MATYSATDFIGKTIFITGNVPVYKYAARKGEKKPKPIEILRPGDSFVVDSFINKNGVYTQFDENYWTVQGGGVVAFSDISGKYNTKAIKDQGVKSDIEKQEPTSTAETLLKKYGLWVAGAIIAVVAVKAYISKK